VFLFLPSSLESGWRAVPIRTRRRALPRRRRRRLNSPAASACSIIIARAATASAHRGPTGGQPFCPRYTNPVTMAMPPFAWPPKMGSGRTIGILAICRRSTGSRGKRSDRSFPISAGFKGKTASRKSAHTIRERSSGQRQSPSDKIACGLRVPLQPEDVLC